MKKLYFLTASLFFFAIGATNAQYFILHKFNDTLGKVPFGSLTLSGNKFYGTASSGGARDSGCIFSIDTNGNNYKDLFDFAIVKCFGASSLTISGNTLYGMTQYGGTKGAGCIFSI